MRRHDHDNAQPPGDKFFSGSETHAREDARSDTAADDTSGKRVLIGGRSSGSMAEM